MGAIIYLCRISDNIYTRYHRVRCTLQVQTAEPSTLPVHTYNEDKLTT